jgi:hypothetical protein
MSALRSYDEISNGGSGASIEVPRSFQPDSDTVLINSESRLFEYPASLATFSPSGISQIVIPQHRSRYILGGTTYLNFAVDVEGAGTLGVVGANQVAVSPALTFLGGPTKSAAALIDRVTISAANGQVLADITNYAQWHNLILCHGASEDYSKNASISENAFSPVAIVDTVSPTTGTTATSFTIAATTATISLPLCVGLFNEQKAFPLWALNGPLMILIQWSSAARSLGVMFLGNYASFAGGRTQGTTATNTVTAASTKWTGKELSLRCRCVDVDTDYVQQQRAMMMAGKVLTFNYRQVQNLITTPAASGVSLSFGVNCSSLLSVFGLTLTTKSTSDGAQIATSKENVIGTSDDIKGSWGFSPHGCKGIRVYRDGTQLSTFALSVGGRDDCFLPLMEAMGILFSTSNASIAQRTLCAATTTGQNYVPTAADNVRIGRGANSLAQTLPLPVTYHYGTYDSGSVYAPNTFAWGLSSRMCNDASVANKGSPCSQLQLTIDSCTSADATMFLYYAYSCSVSFDASGNVLVRR